MDQKTRERHSGTDPRGDDSARRQSARLVTRLHSKVCFLVSRRFGRDVHFSLQLHSTYRISVGSHILTAFAEQQNPRILK
jgi:hypothetical protein